MPDSFVFAPTFVLLGGAVILLLADLLPYPNAKSWVAVLSIATALASLASLSRHTWPLEATLFDWQGTIGDLPAVQFDYYLDPISLILLLCCLFAALCLILYATHYVAAEPKRQLVFYVSILFETAALVNLVLSGSLLVLYFNLQLWIIATYAVMAFWNHGLASTPVTARSFVLASLPCTGLLAAAFVLAAGNPGLNFHDISPLSVPPPTLFLFLLAGAAVAYQYPFHPWTASNFRVPLPAAAIIGLTFAPWAGAYLLSRFHAMAGPQVENLWHQSLMVIGALTMVAGAVYTLKQTHLRGIIVFLAAAQFGYAFLGLGLNTPASIAAAYMALMTGTLAASGLVVCAGMIERATGTGSVLKLGGLAGRMPRTALLFAFFALSLAGVPFPTLGFFAKWVILGAAMDAQHAGFAVLTLIVDVFIFVILLRTMDWVFFRRRYRGTLAGNERSRIPLLSASLLAASLAVLGSVPLTLLDWLIKPAVALIVHAPASGLQINLSGGFASGGFWSSAVTFVLLLCPPVLGLIAYMFVLGNPSPTDSLSARRNLASADENPTTLAPLGQGSAWFPWVINTSGMHSASWRLTAGFAQALRKALSPAEMSYSPVSLLLGALILLLALLE